MGRNLKDYTGTIHGCWKVIERDYHPQSKSHETFWISECQNCGNITSVRKTDLDKNPSSCNDCKGDFSTISKAKKYDILPGEVYGYLTVLDRPHTAQRLGIDKEKNLTEVGKTVAYVKCECRCGNIIYVRKEHLLGTKFRGRTISCGCASMSSGEIRIEELLIESGINYVYNYRIKDFSIFAPFDFAVFDENLELICLIEYDGEQHYNSVNHFGGEEKLQIQRERDQRKDEYCESHNIRLCRIPYWDYDKLDVNYLNAVIRNEKLISGLFQPDKKIL